VVGSDVTNLSLCQFHLDNPGIFDLDFTTMNVKLPQSVYTDERLPSLPCNKLMISTNADEEYIKHLQMQSLLRMLYATRCEFARKPSSGSWTVVIYFASAQCHRCTPIDPFSDSVGRPRPPKTYDTINPKPEIMTYGIINHALDRHELFLIPENHAHDSSLSISLLHDHLCRNLSSAAHRPHLLQLQVDNSGKDNKNRYMIGYAAVNDLQVIGVHRLTLLADMTNDICVVAPQIGMVQIGADTFSDEGSHSL
jgi:hypothetical protein